MSPVLAIDPGTEKSGWALMSGLEVLDFGITENSELIEVVRKYSDFDLAVEMIASYGMAVGQAQPLHSKILTPNGYKHMGDITPKDKVIGIDGKAHDILSIHPQGLKRIYKVEFTDGTYTECCYNHLWGLSTPKRKMRGSGLLVKTTEEIKNEKIFAGKRGYKYVLPNHSPIEFNKSKEELLIHPYIIGVLIGDGSMQYSSVLFTHSEPFIPNKCRSLIHDYIDLKSTKTKISYTHRFVERKKGRSNRYLDFIRRIGLNVKCHNKFIPERYLLSSVEDRINLLQGLIDTDGYICKDGRIQYNTVSEELKTHVCFLIRSLGGNCSVGVKIKENPNHSDSYTISMTFPDNIIPCSFPRKKERLKSGKRQICKSLKSITDTRIDSHMQCITTNAPESLYLTDGLILTHNSTFETCVWIGRFMQVHKDAFKMEKATENYVFRKDVKIHLCGSMRAKDGNIRRAILDKYPATGGGKVPEIGIKSKKGPLFGVASHVWSAIAVGLTYQGL